jgi:hypothetical protein
VRFVVRSLITVALLSVIVVGALVWRLRSGPIPLGFLVPQVKAALDLGPGWQLDVEAVELTWRATAHQVELRARGMRIAPPGDGASVSLAGARIRLSRAALLRGHVVLTAIELDAPALKLVRDTGGRLAMHFDAPEGGTSSLEGVGTMLAKLEHVAVRDGRIAFVDEPSATTWSVPHVDGDLWRAGGPLRVQAELAMAVGEGTVPLKLDAFYRFEAGTLEAQLSSPGANTRTAFAAWPSSLASKAHEWVTKNLTDGRIGTAVLAINGHVVREGTTKLELDSLDASVAFDGLSVRFLDGMPPVTDTKGVARFRRDGVDVAVESGALQGLAVGPARVMVAWPAGARDRLSVDARCSGPLRAMIEVLGQSAGSARRARELPVARHRGRGDGARAARVPARRPARLRQPGASRHGLVHRRDDPSACRPVGPHRRELDGVDGRARAPHRRHGDGPRRAGDGAVPTPVRPPGTAAAGLERPARRRAACRARRRYGRRRDRARRRPHAARARRDRRHARRRRRGSHAGDGRHPRVRQGGRPARPGRGAARARPRRRPGDRAIRRLRRAARDSRAAPRASRRPAHGVTSTRTRASRRPIDPSCSEPCKPHSTAPARPGAPS